MEFEKIFSKYRSEGENILIPKAFLIALFESLQCGISQQFIGSGVICDDGALYEEECIKNWLKKNTTSPLTRNKIHNMYKSITINNIKDLIYKYFDSEYFDEYVCPKYMTYIKQSARIHTLLENSDNKLINYSSFDLRKLLQLNYGINILRLDQDTFIYFIDNSINVDTNNNKIWIPLLKTFIKTNKSTNESFVTKYNKLESKKCFSSLNWNDYEYNMDEIHLIFSDNDSKPINLMQYTKFNLNSLLQMGFVSKIIRLDVQIFDYILDNTLSIESAPQNQDIWIRALKVYLNEIKGNDETKNNEETEKSEFIAYLHKFNKLTTKKCFSEKTWFSYAYNAHAINLLLSEHCEKPEAINLCNYNQFNLSELIKNELLGNIMKLNINIFSYMLDNFVSIPKNPQLWVSTIKNYSLTKPNDFNTKLDQLFNKKVHLTAKEYTSFEYNKEEILNILTKLNKDNVNELKNSLLSYQDYSRHFLEDQIAKNPDLLTIFTLDIINHFVTTTVASANEFTSNHLIINTKIREMASEVDIDIEKIKLIFALFYQMTFTVNLELAKTEYEFLKQLLNTRKGSILTKFIQKFFDSSKAFIGKNASEEKIKNIAQSFIKILEIVENDVILSSGQKITFCKAVYDIYYKKFFGIDSLKIIDHLIKNTLTTNPYKLSVVIPPSFVTSQLILTLADTIKKMSFEEMKASLEGINSIVKLYVTQLYNDTMKQNKNYYTDTSLDCKVFVYTVPSVVPVLQINQICEGNLNPEIFTMLLTCLAECSVKEIIKNLILTKYKSVVEIINNLPHDKQIVNKVCDQLTIKTLFLNELSKQAIIIYSDPSTTAYVKKLVLEVYEKCKSDYQTYIFNQQISGKSNKWFSHSKTVYCACDENHVKALRKLSSQ